MNIYKSGIGDDLVNPVVFTEAIQHYLDAEKELLLALSEPYDQLVEIGCTTGRYAETITLCGKQYLGIDIAAHHIIQAVSLHGHNDKASFLCDDVHNLELILASMDISGKKPLLFFPFNSFGNLDSGYTILEMLRKTLLPFAIFTYATDNATANERAKYYKASGFENLVLSEEGSGVRFIDQIGLNTIAHWESWFKASFSTLHLPFRCIPFSNIGCCYTNF